MERLVEEYRRRWLEAFDKEWGSMSENEQVPVVGGPLDGQTSRLRLPGSIMLVSDSADMIHGSKDGEPYTICGQHIYKLKCYAKDGEERYQWEHVGYQRPRSE